jgi:hypothetical protein
MMKMTTTMMTSKHLRSTYLCSFLPQPPGSFSTPLAFFFTPVRHVFARVSSCLFYFHLHRIILIPSSPKTADWCTYRGRQDTQQKIVRSSHHSLIYPYFLKSSCNSSRFIPSNRSEHHPFSLRGLFSSSQTCLFWYIHYRLG